MPAAPIGNNLRYELRCNKVEENEPHSEMTPFPTLAGGSLAVVRKNGGFSASASPTDQKQARCRTSPGGERAESPSRCSFRITPFGLAELVPLFAVLEGTANDAHQRRCVRNLIALTQLIFVAHGPRLPPDRGVGEENPVSAARILARGRFSWYSLDPYRLLYYSSTLDEEHRFYFSSTLGNRTR
jgi:hypothetical protein